MIREPIYLSHDNASRLFLTEDRRVVGLSSVTRVILTIDGTDYDSDDLGPSRIWWSDQELCEQDGQLHDALKFKLGDQAIPKGRHLNCRLTLFDVSNPNGLVWHDGLTFVVK